MAMKANVAHQTKDKTALLSWLYDTCSHIESMRCAERESHNSNEKWNNVEGKLDFVVSLSYGIKYNRCKILYKGFTDLTL